MEPYMTSAYVIKHGDVSLLWWAMQEMYKILQALSAQKLKYAKEILRQLHIFDIEAFHPQLQTAYLANALLNPCGLPYIFYEIDLLLEYQNREFKQFWSDDGSSLQETNHMFRLYALSADALQKVRLRIVKVIVGYNHTSKLMPIK